MWAKKINKWWKCFTKVFLSTKIWMLLVKFQVSFKAHNSKMDNNLNIFSQIHAYRPCPFNVCCQINLKKEHFSSKNFFFIICFRRKCFTGKNGHQEGKAKWTVLFEGGWCDGLYEGSISSEHPRYLVSVHFWQLSLSQLVFILFYKENFFLEKFPNKYLFKIYCSSAK